MTAANPLTNDMKLFNATNPHVPNSTSTTKTQQWRDNSQKPFKKSQRAHTTILFGGMTLLQDQLVESAARSIGINFQALENPTFEAFQLGKEYGNRGQCNPTYFNVGNLIKYLTHLRDNEGLTTEYILEHFIFLTAGGCGPCRFGMYITEYRKALNDAGFPDFRIGNVDYEAGIFQGEGMEESGFQFTPKFFVMLVKAVILGDIINILGYKIRPYELREGDTDKAIAECKSIISKAFDSNSSIIHAMYKCRKEFDKVKLNRLQVKPKVMVMGEFWAAMTEGDGNYNLHRFLEQEGAEVIPQPTINRLILTVWEAEYALDKKAHLEDNTKSSFDLSSMKSRAMIRMAKAAIKTHFKAYSKAIGLNDFKIADMEHLASLAKEYYPMDSDGGEAHVEVAHLLESIDEKLAHLVISVKPFGCMPSSTTSDGIQSLIVSKFPDANFLPIETSGEGAVNFYSRVQMALFKAKQSAKDEFEALNFDLSKEVPEHVQSYRFQPLATDTQTGSAAVLAQNI